MFGCGDFLQEDYLLCDFSTFYSRMRSKGSRFTLGFRGVEGVFARRCVYVRNRPQPFATVCNRATVRGRPCEARMAVPMVSSAKGVTFVGFKRLRASFSRGRCGTS